MLNTKAKIQMMFIGSNPFENDDVGINFKK